MLLWLSATVRGSIGVVAAVVAVVAAVVVGAVVSLAVGEDNK